MTDPRAELAQFMRTLRPPPGETGASFLRRYDAEFNAGGPPAQVRRGCAIDEFDGWQLTADVYAPPSPDGAAPLLMYLHGGGWVMGNPATHDRMARMFAAAGFVVASVDYPRAPKWRFPAGFDGCLRALPWLVEHGSAFGGDPARVLVAGDSAGANLAAAVAVAAPSVGVDVAAAALLYGIYDYRRALPVLADIVGGSSVDTQQYVPVAGFDQLADDPRLSPERAADLMPPCWIGVGADDPLLGESTALATALDRLHRPHELYVAPGSPHSFLQIPFDAGYEDGWQRLLTFLAAH